MSARFVHTCIRVLQIDRSVRFYGRLGLQIAGRRDVLELTVNVGRDEPCFVADPHGYRIELVDGDFPTPQDPPHPSTA